MNYTLHQLRIFVKLIECQSVTKAAEELYLTQPAISIQLKNFQSQFAVPLTEVVGRQLYITDFGKEVGESAQVILDEIELINYKTKSFDGHLAGQIRIALVSTAKYIMPYFISEFMRMHDGVDLKIDVTNKASVVKSLTDNEIDFALVSVLPEKLQLNKIELMENKLFLVGGVTLQRNPKKPIKKQLEEFPLLLREQGSATRKAMEEFLAQNNIKFKKNIVLTSNEALKQAVVAGLGYSIMPLIGIKNELKNADLEIIPFRGLPITTTWNLTWLTAKKLLPASQALLDYIIANKTKIIDEKFSWIKNY